MNIENSPLSFFENLLEYDKYELLKKQYISDYIEHGGQPYKIDFENGIIEEWNGEFIKYTFSDSFKFKIEQRALDTKREIGSIIEEILSRSGNLQSFLEVQNNKLHTLSFKADALYSHQPIVKEIISELIIYINKFSITSTKDEVRKLFILEESSSNSYNWKSENYEDKLKSIEDLHNLLIIEPAIIECDKQDFINAFSQRKVNKGINWCIKGKNRKISKSSLIYFIDKLINNDLIDDEIEYNKKIEYVFRDNLGKKLQNIKVSKSNYSKKPTDSERIDRIINTLTLT